MTKEAAENRAGAEAEPRDEESDLKWAVEWLVKERGQRRGAKALGVNRKTVALALRRERLTGRMSYAIERYLHGPPGAARRWASAPDEIESGLRSLGESIDEIDDLIEALTLRVETLEDEWARAETVGADDARGGDASGSRGEEEAPPVESAPEPPGRRLSRWWRR